MVPCFYLIGIWKVLRDFRNGHHWRKKKDGEIVNETHEKMKDFRSSVFLVKEAFFQNGEKEARRILCKRIELLCY